MTYDYIITKPPLNEDTLAHYGVKGMKWRQHNKAMYQKTGSEAYKILSEWSDKDYQARLARVKLVGGKGGSSKSSAKGSSGSKAESSSKTSTDAKKEEKKTEDTPKINVDLDHIKGLEKMVAKSNESKLPVIGRNADATERKRKLLKSRKMYL